MRTQSTRRVLLATLLGSTMLVSTPSFAQDAAEEAGGDEIIVTAQKREESLQNVPISIQALSTKKLDQLGVSNFNDFTKQLPSVSFQTTQPGSTTVYMRGVASGGDGNHSGSLPSVGVYLDEQAVTTIGGTLDVHVYDIARIESLAGPQGTLYGASSQAGTIRIITNKPSTAGFEGRADAEVNTIKDGGIGGKLEGMINAPLGDNIALRVVGWYSHSAGFIDNVAATRSFLGPAVLDAGGNRTGNLPGITVNNANFVDKNINEQDVVGGRAALKVDLDDNWTVTPSVLYQSLKNKGSFAYDPSVGDLNVNRFSKEFRNDKFVQAALTIEGKVGNWDLTYAGAYLDRKTKSFNDYTDYAEAYDALYANYTDSDTGAFLCSGISGCFYFNDAAGNVIDPRQFIAGGDHFKKLSQEFRIASPQDKALRLVAGVFYQKQTNAIFQDYQVNNLAPLVSVNGRPGTLWLTNQKRADKDYAAFGEISFDITPKLTITGGGRYFKYDNSLFGFFGFGRNPAFVQGADGNPPANAAGSSRTGVAGCFTTGGLTLRQAQLDGATTTLLPGGVPGTFCTNLAQTDPVTGLAVIRDGKAIPKRTKDDGFTHRLNLTYKASDDVMVYTTWSRGFRPGGINRRASIPPYRSDFLTNFELGWKTTLADGVRFNGSVYSQTWKAFQYAFLGENSFTQIQNGPDARIRGIEADLSVSAARGLTFTAAGAYTNAKTKGILCAGATDTTADCSDSSISAVPGTRLPITPKFKGSATARYEFDLGTNKGHFQAGLAHQGSASSDIRTADALTLGRLEAFTTVDFTAGVDWGNYSAELFVANAFDERGQLSRFQQCGQCDTRIYIVPSQPRTVGLRVGGKF
jgi:iron complex outermembrane recepter protein